MHTSEPQWARLLHDANHGLRRGARYRVAELTSDGAVLDVNRKRVSLPRTSLGLRSVLPQAWTVVKGARDARRVPETWGDKYAVCPSCRNRAALMGNPHTLRCARCGGLFRVGWEEWFLAGS